MMHAEAGANLKFAGDRGLRGIGTVLVLLATVVLAGWVFNVDALKGVVPGFATMKPNTAVCFMLTGVALLLLGYADAARSHRIAQLLGLAVLLVSGLTALEYLLGVDWGIDDLLFSAPGALGGPAMRMSVMTAVAFFAGGTAVMLAPVKSVWWVTQTLALGVGAIATTAVVGYAYGVGALYSVAPFSSMALHTAAGFELVFLGLLLTPHRRGLAHLLGRASVGGTSARRMLAFAVSGPFLLGLTLLVGVRAGWYPVEFGVGLISVTGMAGLGWLVWWHGEWLDRAEMERQVLQEQLLHAQKLEAVGRLAGGIAHDFNNLLSVITAAAGMRMEEAEDDDTLEDLRAITGAADRAAKLTRQLLAFGRQQVLQPIIANLNDIIRGSDHILQRLVTEGVTLETHLDEDLGRSEVDPGQMELVLVNLVVNADQAMPGGGVVSIATRNAELDISYTRRHPSIEPGQYICLVVADNGKGMDADTVANMFEPFFTTRDSGTGLGLATVHGIVNQSGGHIWVYSEVDVGTTIKVYLPRTDQKKSAPPVEAELRPVRGSGETILVVDDEDGVRRVVRRVLERRGYRVVTAVNGTDALAVLAEPQADLIRVVLTDIVMPEMGGGELALQIAETYPEVTTIFMSGYADRTVMDRSILEDGTEWVEKPFTPVEILSAVREALDREN